MNQQRLTPVDDKSFNKNCTEDYCPLRLVKYEVEKLKSEKILDLLMNNVCQQMFYLQHLCQKIV